MKIGIQFLVLPLICCYMGTAEAVVIETVSVGDAGNAGELSGQSLSHGYGPDRMCGSVNYNFNIGKYEVTARQYAEFLNAKAKSDTYGLYNANMGDVSQDIYGCNIQRSGVSGSYNYAVAEDWANRPVNYVSYWDACRFANWLHNGQGGGDTETGAYTLSGYTGNRGSSILRNAGARWFLTSEDEWYKAAYYRGSGTNASYWRYATQSDVAPTNQVLPTDPGNGASYQVDGLGISIGGPYYRTEVGEFENSGSAYGTFDQCGNVAEWNESILYENINYTYRGLRGGSWGDYHSPLASVWRYNAAVPTEDAYLGFRVGSVPEPSSLFGLLGCIGGMAELVRRRRR